MIGVAGVDKALVKSARGREYRIRREFYALFLRRIPAAFYNGKTW